MYQYYERGKPRDDLPPPNEVAKGRGNDGYIR